MNEVHVDAVGTLLMGLDPKKTPYLQFAHDRGLGDIAPEKIEVVDLTTGNTMSADELEAARRHEPLMPLCRNRDEGYYKRFRADGSAVPWCIADINEQREKDGLEPLFVDDVLVDSQAVAAG
ncbi:MAG: hypothetical protein VX733_12925 [Candidatus Latescibacterota bacterium]|nr:hypothetical protein [Candidatus Latescibacterota bacterium]